MPEPTAVYRFFGADKALLYVGVSSRPLARFGEHASDKAWWTEVCTVTLAWFDDRVPALKAEASAIAVERPRYNRVAGFASAGRGQTPVRNFRASDAVWLPALARAKADRRTVTDVINRFLRWYISVPPGTSFSEYRDCT